MADVRDIQMNFTANTSQAEAAINKLKDSTERAAVGLDKQAKSSGTATNALTNFNRIVQDAPFGIMGIANNIDPMVQSFQKLKAETGSTSGAFKAMASTLAGPMGLLFGVNLAVLAIQVLPGLFSKVSASLSGTTEKMRKLTEATKAQAIFSNDTMIKNFGEAKAVEELGKQLLKTNANSRERREVLSQLKAINPEIVKGIDEHTTSEKKLREAVQGATVAVWDKIEAQLTDIFLAPTYLKLAEGTAKFSAAFQKQSAASKGAWDKNNPTTDEQFMQANREMDAARLQLDKINSTFKKEVQAGTANVKNLMLALGGSMAGSTPSKDGKSGSGSSGGAKGALLDLKESIFEMIKTDQLLGRLTTDSNFAKYIEQLTAELAKYKEGTPEFNKTLEGIIELKKQQALVFQMRGVMAGEDSLKMQLKWGDQQSYWAVKGLQGISGDEIRKLDGVKTYSPREVDVPSLDLVKDKNNILLKEGAKAAKKQYDLYKDYFIDPFVSSFQGEFSKAWNSIFGEANSLLEKFIQSLGESLFNKAVGSAASGILGMIFPGFNLLEAAVGGFGGGDRATVNQIIMDGELIATQKQANRTQAIINRQNALR